MSLKKVTKARSKSNAVREALLTKARDLFIALAYEKVSTRMVANAAGVNMAMIRYYFNNKAGLFEAVIRETLYPIKEMQQNPSSKISENTILSFIFEFYHVMSNHINFPRFINRTMQLSPDLPQRKIVERVMLEHLAIIQKSTLNNEYFGEQLKEGVDAKFAHFTLMSISLFPFVAQPEMLNLHNITIDGEFLTSLADHNKQLLNHGMLK